MFGTENTGAIGLWGKKSLDGIRLKDEDGYESGREAKIGWFATWKLQFGYWVRVGAADIITTYV